MHDADDERAVGEVVEYCRTQAGLLAGRVETMAAEAETLIDEIDEGVADLRASLDQREQDAADAADADGDSSDNDAGAGEAADADDDAGVGDRDPDEAADLDVAAEPDNTSDPAAARSDTAEPTDGDVSDLVDAESNLKRKQATVEATETRMRLFQELASDYLDLADDLLAEHEAGDADADDAVRRVVSFEAERDAPAYFDERETLVEVAQRGDGGDGGDGGDDSNGDTDPAIDGE